MIKYYNPVIVFLFFIMLLPTLVLAQVIQLNSRNNSVDYNK